MNFLVRYGNIFLFLLLEGYALFLVARYNDRPNQIYQSTANIVTGAIFDRFSAVRQFFSMSALADSLARENADLRTQLENMKYVAVQEKGIVSFPLDSSTIRPDTAPRADVIQRFSYMSAEIINNSIARNENYLTINKGAKHGLKQGMGVVSSDGIVGIVRNVETEYAQVMSVLNTRISVSAMIKRNRYFGSLRWRGGDPKIMTLETIPKHADVVKGDTIVTTGFALTSADGAIFPGALRIGRVVDFRVENGFYSIDVALDNDLSNIRYVYVINDIYAGAFKKDNIK